MALRRAIPVSTKYGPSLRLADVGVLDDGTAISVAAARDKSDPWPLEPLVDPHRRTICQRLLVSPSTGQSRRLEKLAKDGVHVLVPCLMFTSDIPLLKERLGNGFRGRNTFLTRIPGGAQNCVQAE